LSQETPSPIQLVRNRGKEEKMLKKTIVTLLFSMSSILFISINCFGQLPGPPSIPDTCIMCHGFDIYDEWHQSEHGALWEEDDNNIETDAKAICFDCHIPGPAQKVENDTLEPGEKKGFHVLGYYDDAEGWVRKSSPKEVCLRCHAGLDRQCRFKRVRKACHQCHMPVDGLKTYRVHKLEFENPGVKIISLDDKNNNIAKYVTREHRNHKFPNLK